MDTWNKQRADVAQQLESLEGSVTQDEGALIVLDEEEPALRTDLDTEWTDYEAESKDLAFRLSKASEG